MALRSRTTSRAFVANRLHSHVQYNFSSNEVPMTFLNRTVPSRRHHFCSYFLWKRQELLPSPTESSRWTSTALTCACRLSTAHCSQREVYYNLGRPKQRWSTQARLPQCHLRIRLSRRVCFFWMFTPSTMTFPEVLPKFAPPYVIPGENETRSPLFTWTLLISILLSSTELRS